MSDSQDKTWQSTYILTSICEKSGGRHIQPRAGTNTRSEAGHAAILYLQ